MSTFRPVTRVCNAPEKVGVKKTKYHGGVKLGLFPTAFRISERVAVVYDDELAAIVAARAAGCGDDAVRALVKRLMAARSPAGGLDDAPPVVASKEAA